jgi:hypothetical protein
MMGMWSPGLAILVLVVVMAGPGGSIRPAHGQDWLREWFRPAKAAAPTGPAGAQPVYAVGDRWLLAGGTYELVRADRDRYVFASGRHEIHLGKDLTPVAVVRDGTVAWELYPPPGVAWPLETGKWAIASAVLRNRDNPGGLQVRVAWEVKAAESVRVPAGTYEAVPVSYAIEVDPGLRAPGRVTVRGRTAWTMVTWYAPALKQVIKVTLPGEDLLDLQVVAVQGGGTAAGVPAPPRTPAPAPKEPTRPAAPLTVEIRHPDDRAVVTGETSVVAALVTSGKGVAEVSVSLNGTEVWRRPERGPEPSVAVSTPVTLRQGTNVIVVRAAEADGATRQEMRIVTLERAPPPATPAPLVSGPAPPQDRWAVVIGIGTYERPEIPGLRFAVADAEAVHDVLVNRAGFRKEQVLLLTDRTERKPTLRNLKWALGTFLARSAKKGDLVLIYYAGHGAPEIDPRGLEADGFAKYLVPWDADPNDLYSTGLPMDEFQTIFDRIEAERVVVFLDACYSGAAGGRTFASRRTRATRIDDLFLERLTRSRGRVIVTASRAAEVSLELPELGHGVFTHFLLQGLRGVADLDRDGIINLQELYQYLEQKVSQRSRAEGGNQHPVLRGEVEGLFPLVKIGSR